MARTRLAGCLAFVAFSAFTGLASAEVICPGSVIYPDPPPPVGPLVNDPSIFDPSYRPLGDSHIPSGVAPLDQITFRYDEPGVDRLAPRIPAVPRDPAMMHVTFAPGSAPKTQHTVALVGSAYAPGSGGDPAFARSPGAVMMLARIEAPGPAGYSRPPLDPSTLSLSVIGIGVAGAIISLAIMKLPR